MNKSKLSSGVVHKMVADIEKVLTGSAQLQNVWEDITPLARNEWLCWITSAKQDETRKRRLRIMSENLRAGKRRPCCWAGCMHR